jgi:hypothetical protein
VLGIADREVQASPEHRRTRRSWSMTGAYLTGDLKRDERLRLVAYPDPDSPLGKRRDENAGRGWRRCRRPGFRRAVGDRLRPRRARPVAVMVAHARRPQARLPRQHGVQSGRLRPDQPSLTSAPSTSSASSRRSSPPCANQQFAMAEFDLRATPWAREAADRAARIILQSAAGFTSGDPAPTRCLIAA